MKYYLEPLGCVKNQVDAETMMGALEKAGFERAESCGDSDLIIVNSCGFIEEAKKESIDTLLSFRKWYPDKKIMLSGCLAERYATELRCELSEADAVFGNRDLNKVSEIALALTGGPLLKTAQAENKAYDRPLLSAPGSACVKIAEGCNNRCTFCAIPLIRGELRSRKIDDIVSECKALLKRGIKEIALIAQDSASYGIDTDGTCMLGELLRAISALDGSFWIRLLYLHPDHFPFDILDTISEDKRFLPYFDIPFQHVSKPLLRSMNRSGDAQAYLSLINAIREKEPGAVIRSSFLAGFPGESEADFEELLDFQRNARLDWLGVFRYSREEGTPAYSFKSRVAQKTILARKKLLEERQIPITEKQMDRFTARELTALVEEAIDGEEGLYLGRLYCHAAEVDGCAVIESGTRLYPGDFVRGTVTGRAGFDLRFEAKMRD